LHLHIMEQLAAEHRQELLRAARPYHLAAQGNTRTVRNRRWRTLADRFGRALPNVGNHTRRVSRRSQTASLTVPAIIDLTFCPKPDLHATTSAPSRFVEPPDGHGLKHPEAACVGVADDLRPPGATEISGTWLEPAPGTGVNTEAKQLTLSLATEAWRLQCLTLKSDARSTQSRMAIERIGASYEGTRRAHMSALESDLGDTAYYSISYEIFSRRDARTCLVYPPAGGPRDQGRIS